MNALITNIELDPKWETKTLSLKKEHQSYVTKDGVKLPGCTTVLGEMNKPALINWSADLERKELTKCFENGSPVPDKLFYLTMRDTAATIGTCAHFICECYLTKFNPAFEEVDNEIIEKAKLSFNKFKAFWETSGYEVVASETQLVSEKLRFGGTIDIIAKDQQSNLVLLDLKTNKAIYLDQMGMQCAGYKMLWEDNDPRPITKVIIVRIGKEAAGDFEVKEIDYILPFETAFKTLVDFYHQKRQLPKK